MKRARRDLRQKQPAAKGTCGGNGGMASLGDMKAKSI
jgi:hypothetical protein